jgi:hypothetical protein
LPVANPVFESLSRVMCRSEDALMEEKEKIFAARAALQSTAAEDTAMAKAAMERMAKDRQSRLDALMKKRREEKDARAAKEKQDKERLDNERRLMYERRARKKLEDKAHHQAELAAERSRRLDFVCKEADGAVAKAQAGLDRLDFKASSMLGDGANQIEFVHERPKMMARLETAKRLAEQARANLEAALEMTKITADKLAATAPIVEK